MNETKAEIFELINSSVLLGDRNKNYLFSFVNESDDIDFLHEIIVKLRNENDHIVAFLKDLIVNTKEFRTPSEIKKEMTRVFLFDLKRKEKDSRIEEITNMDSLLTQLA